MRICIMDNLKIQSILSGQFQENYRVFLQRFLLVLTTFALLLCVLMFSFILFILVPQFHAPYYAVHDSTMVQSHTPYPLLYQGALVKEWNQDFTRELRRVVLVESQSAFVFTPNPYFDKLSEREAHHMDDVLLLMRQTVVLFWISLVGSIFLLNVLFTKKLIMRLKKYFIRVQIGFSIVAAVSVFFFSAAFVQFHRLLFSNDLWMLPYNSFLIQTFPQGYFIWSFVCILIIYAVLQSGVYVVLSAIVRQTHYA